MSTQKKVFAFWRNLDFDDHLRTAQLQKSSHLQKIQKNLKKMYSCLHYQRLLRKCCKDSYLDQVLKLKVTILKQSKIRKSSSLPCAFSINSTYKIQLHLFLALKVNSSTGGMEAQMDNNTSFIMFL